MSEFEVAGQTYRSGKMPARTQFHVLRRAATIVGPIQTLSVGSASGDALNAVTKAIASLTDEESDYILDNCLAVVERRQGEASWAKIKTSGGPGLMFMDIDMMAMLQIASHVLRDNFEGFFATASAT